MEIVKAHVYIAGRVQGVFFRASTRNEASSLKIKGWVKNCVDGSVEAVFEGDKNKVNKMVHWCYNGPPGAFVNDVKVVWGKPTGEYSDFSVKY